MFDFDGQDFDMNFGGEEFFPVGSLYKTGFEVLSMGDEAEICFKVFGSLIETAKSKKLSRYQRTALVLEAIEVWEETIKPKYKDRKIWCFPANGDNRGRKRTKLYRTLGFVPEKNGRMIYRP
jgi:hypothetical protein